MATLPSEMALGISLSLSIRVAVLSGSNLKTSMLAAEIWLMK
jgi:hypothetical protein